MLPQLTYLPRGNLVVTKTNTITPLILAAADGMIRGEGINVESTLNSLAYEYFHYEQITSPPGYTLQGTMRCFDTGVYDEYTVANSVTNPNTGVVTTTYTLVQDYIGDFEDLFPNSWSIDGWVYTGSLAAFGAMVAERVSPGYASRYTATYTANSDPMVTYSLSSSSYDGRYRDFWGDPTKATLGANTIPALTQVVSANVSTKVIEGSMALATEKSINDPLGSNTGVDIYKFIKNFGMMYGYLMNANRYLNATRNAEKKTLGEFNVNSYQEFVAQDWVKYQQGHALREAFKNIGTMTDTIYTGKFGTVGSVVYTLLGRGLASVGNLGLKVTKAHVNVDDINNPMYVEQLTRFLSEITAPSDLEIIQQTIGSTIPNMTSPLDYTSISKSAGMDNDSVFADFAEVGVDLYNKGPYMTVASGADIVNIIDSILSPKYSSVETLHTSTSLLPSAITDRLRNRLPSNPTDSTVTLYDGIGSPTGYYSANLAAVIQGINELDNTAHGPAVRHTLQEIVNSTNYFVSASGPVGEGRPLGSLDPYNALMQTILNDPGMDSIVNKINNNYDHIVMRVDIERNNWAMANIPNTVFNDVSTIDTFSTSLHGYATESQGLETYQYLMDVADSSQTGSTIESVLAEGKNYKLLNEYTVNVNGYIA